jgi:hypothetical protein
VLFKPYYKPEYYPEENEIEYRLAGLYFMIKDNTESKIHLSNALRLNFEYILEDIFPVVWTKKWFKLHCKT